MSISDLFVRIRDALLKAMVPYMLTGSFAGSRHGVPRATQDVDIVIAPLRSQLLRLLDAFPETEYYVDRETALNAPASYGKFNLIDYTSGWKVDFIFRKNREFSFEEFERRMPMDLLGVTLDVASP